MLLYHYSIRCLEPLFPFLKIIGVLVRYENVGDQMGTRWGLQHGQKILPSCQWAMQQSRGTLGRRSSLLG